MRDCRLGFFIASCVTYWLFVQSAMAVPTRIVPLGDSITHGSVTYPTYRYPLWQALIDGGYEFDYVGSLNTNQDGLPDLDPYQGHEFDHDHEGHGGWRADQVLTLLDTTLADYTPDVALIHLGTNDLFQSELSQSAEVAASATVADLEEIVVRLRMANPQVSVLIAQIFPTDRSVNAYFDTFNAQLAAEIGAWHQESSPVILVDQNSGFTPNRNADPTHSYDGVHPNHLAEEIMAQRWFDALVSHQLVNRANDGTVDLNGDGMIDAGDATILFSNWGLGTVGLQDGDINLDGAGRCCRCGNYVHIVDRGQSIGHGGTGTDNAAALGHVADLFSLPTAVLSLDADRHQNPRARPSFRGSVPPK